ncbi:MAG: hypothetical protein DRO76_01570 [Candidatus Altiarchaeales archaeon]|nr:MAG: hypothetical protein DRO76_01570 [Candidatus Altiarchaeales archaeon]
MALNTSVAVPPVFEYPITMDQIMSTIVEYGMIGLLLIAAFIGGYILGYIASKVLRRVLMIGELQKTLVRYGAVTSKLWESIVNFIAQYVIWLIVIFVIHTVFVQPTGVSVTGELIYTHPLIDSLFKFMVNLLSLILFAIIGLLLGGVLYKIIKDTLEAMGLEAELEKHKITESLGGISLSTILAGIVKWYVVLLFLTTGVQQFLSTIQIGEEELFLEKFMVGLMDYVPHVVLGILVILASLILASLAADKIRYRPVNFAEPAALAVEVVVIFFGFILGIPFLFGFADKEIFSQSFGVLTESFKYIVIGISIGLVMALGLGLKDVVAKAGIKYEEELTKNK